MTRSTTLALFASLLVSSAFGVLACSSTSDATTPGPTDSGKADTGTAADTSTTDTGTADDTSTTDTGTAGDTSTGETGSDAGTCGSNPTLHPVTAGAGVYCPGASDAGTGSTCAAGQFCCDTPIGSAPASGCIASTATCPTTAPKAGSTWECDAPVHCTGGKVCCGLGTPKLRTGCTYEEVYPAKGSKCATSCGTAEYIVCEVPADCTGGKTCTPIKSGGKQIGYCK